MGGVVVVVVVCMSRLFCSDGVGGRLRRTQQEDDFLLLCSVGRVHLEWVSCFFRLPPQACLTTNASSGSAMRCARLHL